VGRLKAPPNLPEGGALCNWLKAIHRGSQTRRSKKLMVLKYLFKQKILKLSFEKRLIKPLLRRGLGRLLFYGTSSSI
jgi:hypothetical protein